MPKRITEAEKKKHIKHTRLTDVQNDKFETIKKHYGIKQDAEMISSLIDHHEGVIDKINKAIELLKIDGHGTKQQALKVLGGKDNE